MAQSIADRRDIDFVLHEQLGVDELSKHERFEEFNRKTVDLIVSEARNLAIKEILPTREIGDKEGTIFENGKVTVPQAFHKAWELFKEGEWVAMTEDPEWGGQGMPRTLALAAGDYFNGANYAFMMYPGLTHGAGKLVLTFGTDELKQRFLKQMFTGQWTGTMLLTEPEAGSDVGALATSAVKNEDGTYSITGSKIFISSGEHDMAENIIHPVLARIEGAPEGTKGISLFLVPKYFVNDDGSLGDRNDIVCSGVEEKHGIHASATCSMTLGSKGKCIGYLLGTERQGMKIMFNMINHARMSTGLQAMAYASSAYLLAVNYARERIQGRDLENFMDHSAPSVPIIRHPDVRRNLLWMKSYVDGMRSFFYYMTRCASQALITDAAEEQEKYGDLFSMLTPIVKDYMAVKGHEVCIQAIQVYGGAGYTRDYLVEQYARDCKITSIYEGTSGIQAMDLLARKIGMKKGLVFMNFLGEIQKTTARAKAVEALNDLGVKVENTAKRLGEIALHIGKMAMSPDFKVAFAHALPFLYAVGDVVMAWMLLWRAVVASEKLAATPKKKDIAFYEGQIKTAEFFINTELPLTSGKMDSIKGGCAAAIEISDEGFGGL